VVIEVGVCVGIIDRGVVDVGACPHVVFDEKVDASELAAGGDALVYGIRGGTG
jgi:hypothetical protein